MERDNNKFYHAYLAEEDKTKAEGEAKELAQGIVDRFEESGVDLQEIQQGNAFVEERRAVDEYNTNHPDNNQVEFWGNLEHNTLMATFNMRNGDVIEEIVSSNTPPELSEEPYRTEYYDSFIPVFGNATFDTNMEAAPLASSSGEDAYSNEVSEPSIESSSSGGESYSTPTDPVSNDAAEGLNDTINDSPTSQSVDSSSSSSSSELENEVPSESLKRSREDDSDDEAESSKRRRVDEGFDVDTISSLYDLAGDD